MEFILLNSKDIIPGVLVMKFSNILGYTILGSFIISGLFCFLGIITGNMFLYLIGIISNYVFMVSLALGIIVGIVYLIVKFFKKRKEKKDKHL